MPSARRRGWSAAVRPSAGSGLRTSPKRSSAGGWPPLKARPPSSTCMELLGEHAAVCAPVAELVERIVAERIGAAIAVLVGDDEVEVLAVAERAIGLQAVDRGEVVGLHAQAVLVQFLDLDVLDGDRAERVERCRWAACTRAGMIFEPRLVGGDLDRSGPAVRTAAGLLDALPALPGEFVIVPDGDERPARAGVLQVGVGEIALVDGAIAVDGQRVSGNCRPCRRRECAPTS